MIFRLSDCLSRLMPRQRCGFYCLFSPFYDDITAFGTRPISPMSHSGRASASPPIMRNRRRRTAHYRFRLPSCGLARFRCADFTAARWLAFIIAACSRDCSYSRICHSKAMKRLCFSPSGFAPPSPFGPFIDATSFFVRRRKKQLPD